MKIVGDASAQRLPEKKKEPSETSRQRGKEILAPRRERSLSANVTYLFQGGKRSRRGEIEVPPVRNETWTLKVTNKKTGVARGVKKRLKQYKKEETIKGGPSQRRDI